MRLEKKNKNGLRAISGFLAGLFLCGSLAACRGANEPIPATGTDKSSATEEETDPNRTPSDYPAFEDLSYAETIGKPKIRAAFAGKSISTGIPVLLTSRDGGVSVNVAATWTSEGVTLRFSDGKADVVALSMGSYSKMLTLVQGSGSITISPETTGLVLVDVGQELPLTMEIRNGMATLEFDGCVLLNDYDTFFSEDGTRFSEQFNKAKLLVLGKTDAVSNADSGARVSDGKITVFGRYTAIGKNYGHLRNAITSKPITGLGYAQKTSCWNLT